MCKHECKHVYVNMCVNRCGIMSKHMTHTIQKEKKEKENQMKRTFSVPEKSNFKCSSCPHSSRSKWALKAHINHNYKEPTSPSEKKPKINAVKVEDIISEVVQNIPVPMEEDCENKSNKLGLSCAKLILS